MYRGQLLPPRVQQARKYVVPHVVAHAHLGKSAHTQIPRPQKNLHYHKRHQHYGIKKQAPRYIPGSYIYNGFGKPDKSQRRRHLGQPNERNGHYPGTKPARGKTQKLKGSFHRKPILNRCISFLYGTIKMCETDKVANFSDLFTESTKENHIPLYFPGGLFLPGR
ncbi:MAG: hypothetical protein BWX52_01829 [Bacteroidetes bacterium ADurb.Bin013]|nr:MAG: hypothetical protein BWX52_01829 [Bacteroidetes bacterium ADurb.Bin013]